MGAPLPRMRGKRSLGGVYSNGQQTQAAAYLKTLNRQKNSGKNSPHTQIRFNRQDGLINLNDAILLIKVILKFLH